METYYQKNKDIIKQKARERYNTNRESILLQKKDYYKKNKETKKEYQNNYYKLPDKHKSRLIYGWQKKGIISDDYDSLYDKYINTHSCELCECDITNGSGIIGRRHLDHDHETGLFRNILCGKCNINLNKKKLKSLHNVNEESGDTIG